ncbi:MAG: hypothetical protein HY329_27190 [Chloroflexi bacterium]|nr:hypothetical protein [Chloroflexota bacterium]
MPLLSHDGPGAAVETTPSHLTLVRDRRSIAFPLEIQVPHPDLQTVPLAVRRRIERGIQFALDEAHRDGWEPLGSTELDSLWHSGQIDVQTRPHPQFGIYSRIYVAASVTLRVERLVLSPQRLDQQG